MDELTAKQLEYLSNDPIVTHTVEFQISKKIEGELYGLDNTAIIGSLTIGLFGSIAPKTVSNFVNLCNLTFGFGYKNTKIHRIVKDFVIQGGDFERGDGTGGHSIFFKKFEDENFILHHNKVGRLSMANSGPNTNGAQFFITTKENLSFLNGVHVVFGQVIDGFNTLLALNTAATDPADRPQHEVFISEVQVNDFHLDDEIEKLGHDLFYAHNDAINKPEVIAKPDDNIPEWDEGPNGTYKWLYLLCFVAVGALLRHFYYKRQYITDIKDGHYF